MLRIYIIPFRRCLSGAALEAILFTCLLVKWLPKAIYSDPKPVHFDDQDLYSTIDVSS